MSTRTVEQIDSWDTVPFSGGYSGLQDLADSEFSGAVVAGPTRLFMLNGNVVGILDGSIDDFEDADGTARTAPHPGLPLLAVMQERSDEVRAKYYTEDTPISEVDQTLSSGGFTGYVELSENVLSGDYYQIYHQGRSMSVAWVGNSDQLLTEDEAFEQADDEVGIYEVRPVDIDIVEIPDPPAADETAGNGSVDEPAPTADAADSDDSGDEGTAADDESEGVPPENESIETDTSTGATGTDPVAKTGGETPTRRATDTEESETNESAERAAEAGVTDAEATSQRGAQEPDAEGQQNDSPPPQSGSRSGSQGQVPEGDRRPRSERSSQPERSAERRTEPAPSRDSSEPRGQSGPAAAADRVTQSEGQPASRDETDLGDAPHDPSTSVGTDLETRSIPSLDPSHSETASKSMTPDRTDSDPSTAGRREQSSAGTADAPSRQPEQGRRQPREQPEQDNRQPQEQPEQPRRQSQQGHPGAPAEERSERDRQGTAGNADGTSRSEPTGQASQPSETPARSERVDELETALEESESEREHLAEELDSLRDEREELEGELENARAEIEQLEQRIEEMAAEDDDTPTAETRLSQREAIDQTNLFVRYDSKGDATLEAVHSGNGSRSDVDDNLRLEFHTQFDADTAAVGNQQFEAFLTQSIQFRFVDWLVRNLLYEIRDTGNPEGMKGLYNALPKIDRAELNGTISVEYTEEGEQHRSQEQFDVVVRDRMGNPLIVANINNSRDPATDDMMTDLITRAERVGSSSESLAGAFLVTESFFEPPALETAEEATSSGLLSRDKRKSFVNLTRKDGYHLCLVEARNQEFHLAVPEL